MYLHGLIALIISLIYFVEMKMKFKSVVLCIMLSSSLVACSKSKTKENIEDPQVTKINELTSKVDALAYQLEMLKRNTISNTNATEAKIAEIEGEVATIFASSSLAYDEAMKCHTRINNLSQSYTK